MSKNIFFKKKNIKIKNAFPAYDLKRDFIINNIRPLHQAQKNDVTFFDSIKYRNLAEKTKASVCITLDTLKGYLPNKIEKIIVKNVLVEVLNITKKIYPFSDVDYPDLTLLNLVIMF